MSIDATIYNCPKCQSYDINKGSELIANTKCNKCGFVGKLYEDFAKISASVEIPPVPTPPAPRIISEDK